MPNFSESTQRLKWMFTEQQLKQLRCEGNATAIARSKELVLSHTPDQLQHFAPLSVEEERIVERYYIDTIAQICDRWKLPFAVEETACVLLKRFFLRSSVMVCDITQFMLASLFFSCKVEENHVNLELFCAKIGDLTGLKVARDTLLATEMQLMEGIQFYFYVFHPIRSLDALFHDVQQVTKFSFPDPNSVLEEAKKVLKLVAQSDALFLYPPGTIALAALFEACKELTPEPMSQYLQHVKHSLEKMQQVVQRIKHDTSFSVESARPILQKLKTVRTALRQSQNKDAERVKQEAARIQEEKRQAKIKRLEEEEQAEEELLLGNSTSVDKKGSSMFD